VETAELVVETSQGPGRFLLDRAAEPYALLVLGHGAGGGPHAADLELLARELPRHGVSVARFEQPWRTAGRKVASRPAQLDEAWRPAIHQLRQHTGATDRLVFGGRSAGARVACRTANEFGVSGVVGLAFPLHLPGRPEQSRLPELLSPTAPRLVLQGTRDAFGSAAELRTALQEVAATGVRVIDLPGADHGFRTLARAEFTPSDLRRTLVDQVGGFIAAPGIPVGGPRCT